MPRKSRPSDNPFGPGDTQLLDFIRRQDAITRASLHTLARRGVAFRQAEPERAAKWLDFLSCHPLYKAGQFLFDLLEWEDFMLDGPPPQILGAAEMVAILRRVANMLSSLQGQTVAEEMNGEFVASVDLTSLPKLEPGFYLYRDVVLGGLAFILGNASVFTTGGP